MERDVCLVGYCLWAKALRSRDSKQLVVLFGCHERQYSDRVGKQGARCLLTIDTYQVSDNRVEDK